MNNSKIILYRGRRGSGKTLTMVKDGYQYHKDGWKVLRNFNCSFGEEITNEKILKLDKKSKLFNCVIMIDEVQIFFNSRRSMRKENINFSNFIQQIRKRNIILLITSQFSNTVDIILRQHTDILAFPNYLDKFKVCEVTYLDVTFKEEDINFISLHEVKQNYVKVIYNAKPIFKLFKTEEMII